MKNWLRRFELELRMAMSRPEAQLSRRQRVLIWVFDFIRHGHQEMRQANATTMAAALTYRTIFGLVPMIVMALIVFRAFGGFEGSQEGLTNIVYNMLGLNTAAEDQPPPAEDKQSSPAPAPEQNPQPATRHDPDKLSWFGRTIHETTGSLPPSAQPADDSTTTDRPLSEEENANQELRDRIDELIGGLAEGATSIRIGGIGVVGMLLLIWAALGLVVTVEKTFNTIYKAPRGRPWHMRIPIYWAVITLGPVLIWGSFYLSTQLVAFFADWGLLGRIVLWVFTQFSALLVTWVLFLLLFKLLPNTRVAIKSAMVGALVSAFAWELMKLALRGYIEGAIVNQTHARLYGSLALIPIMLFWVYLTWMVIITGLEVSHILQTLPGKRLHFFADLEATPAPIRDPWLVIPVMSTVAQAFDTGKTQTLEGISRKLGAPPATVKQIIDELARRGLLHRIGREEGPEELTLALPPSRIRIADLIAAAPEQSREDLPGHELLKQLAQAQDAALADVTLAGRREE